MLFTVSAHSIRNGTRPTAVCALSRALPRAQAATWAWAGNSAWRAHPPGLKTGPVNLRRLSDRTVARADRANKNPLAAAPSKTLTHSFSLGLKPSLLAQKTANAGSAQLTARAQAAPRPQPGPGPAKHRAPRARLGRSVGPIICSRSI